MHRRRPFGNLDARIGQPIARGDLAAFRIENADMRRDDAIRLDIDPGRLQIEDGDAAEPARKRGIG
ncbi:hypothetical protein QFZ53_002434 [Microbacterium natoriense]|uniref:Uncharacterized protein n=1 Tax=Microbacterium natoriense TaxID=284570 RepID=A0AAW8EXJ6_9MICO|nr:hypothetical protein [Microbacterium natoriense]